MKSLKKVAVRIFSMMIVAIMMFNCLGVVAFAEDETKDANVKKNKMDDNKYGIVEIVYYYVDVNGETHIENRGTGFLVGTEKDGITGVITTMKTVTLTENQQKNIKVSQKKLTGKEDLPEMKTVILLKDEITIPLNYVNGAAGGDYAVLTPTAKMETMKWLTLQPDSSILSQGDFVYSLGFPTNVTDVMLSGQYNPDTVEYQEGTITNLQSYGNYKIIHHSCTEYSGCSGSPLFNENGEVIGISSDRTNEEDPHYFAVETEHICFLLDTCGIAYTIPEIPAETEPVTTEEVTEAPTTTVAASEETVLETGEGEGEESNQPSTVVLVAIIAVAVILLIVIIVIIILIIKSGNDRKKKPMNKIGGNGSNAMYSSVPNGMPGPMPAPKPAPAPNSNPAPQPAPGGFGANAQPPVQPTFGQNKSSFSDGSSETSVLSSGAAQTSVLGASGAKVHFSGSLTRVKNHQTIQLTGESFAVGKERARVDYCIDDNTSVSRVHVIIKMKGGVYFLTDNNSTNHTFVNGNMVSPNQEVLLRDGDKIAMSDEEFIFHC